MARAAVPATTSPLAAAFALALGPAAAQGFSRFAYALLVPSMRDDLGWSLAEVGGAATANAVGYLVGALLAGGLSARFGERRVFAIGMTGTAVVLLAPAMASAYGAMLGIRLVAGIAGATAFVAGGGIAARLPTPPGSASPLAVYFAGGGIGIALSGLIVPGLVDGSDGSWRLGWVALSGLAAICAFVALRGSKLVATSAPHAVRGDGPAIPLRAIHLAYGLFGAGYVAYMTFVIALLAERGDGWAFQSLFWVVIGATATAAAFAWRRLPARITPRRELALANALTGLGVVVILPWSHPALTIASALVFGGSFLNVAGAVTGLARTLAPPDDWTRVIGTLTGAFAVGQCSGPLVAGALADRPGGIASGLLLSVGLLAGAALVSLRQTVSDQARSIHGMEKA